MLQQAVSAMMTFALWNVPQSVNQRRPAGLRVKPRLKRSTEWVSILGDARSFSGPTSKIPPLGSMLNFDADVKTMTARHPM